MPPLLTLVSEIHFKQRCHSHLSLFHLFIATTSLVNMFQRDSTRRGDTQPASGNRQPPTASSIDADSDSLKIADAATLLLLLLLLPLLQITDKTVISSRQIQIYDRRDRETSRAAATEAEA